LLGLSYVSESWLLIIRKNRENCILSNKNSFVVVFPATPGYSKARILPKDVILHLLFENE
jgi:hypothetical protein